MKTITTSSNDLIILEVPEDACNFRFAGNETFLFCTINNVDVLLKSYNFSNHKILGKLSELSEEECERFVHKMIGNNPPEQEIKFRGKYYNYLDYTIYCLTAKESLISLLQSNRVDTNKNLLLIEIL